MQFSELHYDLQLHKCLSHMPWKASLDTFGIIVMHWATTRAIPCTGYAQMGLLITHPISHYIYFAVERSKFTFKLSKIGDACYVYRPTNQDQEQTMMMQRGFKGSQRPSVTTWMLPGLVHGSSSSSPSPPTAPTTSPPACPMAHTHTSLARVVWRVSGFTHSSCAGDAYLQLQSSLA